MDEPSRYDQFSAVEFVFLDRDGVINKKAPEGQYIWQWCDFHALAGVESAIAALNNAGKRVIVVTNQRGIALGLYQLQDVNDLHVRLQKHLENFGAHIDAFYVCPHDKNQCDCRKPGTGLFEQAFHDFPIASTKNSILIGDSISDIQAARKLGLPSILITRDGQSTHPSPDSAVSLATVVSNSLIAAVEKYLI
jgi:D-glycero-D-manno-heptose 1,7-bisphosphate phosphatase